MGDTYLTNFERFFTSGSTYVHSLHSVINTALIDVDQTYYVVEEFNHDTTDNLDWASFASDMNYLRSSLPAAVAACCS